MAEEDAINIYSYVEEMAASRTTYGLYLSAHGIGSEFHIMGKWRRDISNSGQLPSHQHLLLNIERANVRQYPQLRCNIVQMSNQHAQCQQTVSCHLT